MELKLSYGNRIVTTEISEKNFLRTLMPNELPVASDANLEIQNAIQKPIKNPKLDKIIKPNMKISILADDYTRGTPAYLIIPYILNKFNKLGVPDENITVIFACGVHRNVKGHEAENLVGKETLERVNTLSHDCNAKNLVYIGKTSSGNEIKINPIVSKSDVIIATGNIEYHYYAGFTGGRKCILPGVSSYEAINYNHSLLTHPKAITGNLDGNPVHKDMLEAAKLVKSIFIINLVRNGKGEVVKAFAGDLEAAHLEGVKFYDKMFRVKVKERADIVLLSAGGYPKDIDLYQGTKAIDNAKFLVRPGGVIIALLECKNGVGNKVYQEWASKYKSLEELEKQVKTNFVLGGHKAYYMKKILSYSSIILVSEMPPKEVKKTYNLIPANSVEDALEMAYNIVGKNANLIFMPFGSMTLPNIVN